MKGAPAGSVPRAQLALTMLCLALCACARHHKAAAGSASALASETSPADSLDLQFRALQASMREGGLRSGGLFQRGFLPPGARAAYGVHVVPGECAVFVALATASMADLDAALYTIEGVALVEDDSASSRPSLTVCAAAQPIDAYLTLHAYHGAGSFIAAQFTRARAAEDDLRTTNPDSSISALGQLAQTLHERGFEDVAPRVNLPLADANPVRMALNVAAGECYTLAAEGAEGLAEVGLRLVDVDGGELANGVGEPQLAALQFCANERAELAIEVSARRGQGIARVARFRAAQAMVGGARALWLGEPSPSAAAWANAKVPLAAPGSGAGGPGKPARGESIALRQGQVVELERRAPAGACERWELALEPGLWRATLRIEDEQGALIGEAESKQMRACLVRCGAPGRRRVTLLGRAGFGAVVLRASAAARDSAAASGCIGP